MVDNGGQHGGQQFLQGFRERRKRKRLKLFEECSFNSKNVGGSSTKKAWILNEKSGMNNFFCNN